MERIVQLEEDVIGAMTDNLAAWIPLFGHLPGARVESLHGCARWTSDVPLPMFNGVFGWPDAADMDNAVGEILRPFAAEAIPLLWVVPPPNDGAAALGARGFRPSSVPGMVADLALLPDAEESEGVEVLRVDDDGRLLDEALGISLMTNGFPQDAAAPLRHALEASAEGSQSQTFLATVGGVPAAASTLWCAAGVAGLYNVGTLPGYRGRGLGALVSVAAMAAGRDAGYRTGVLQASDMGRPIYERLGFEERCRFTFAVRVPA
jgi:GNAT superfamily N-acetyltransferase